MNDLIINHIAELILPKSTDKPLKGKELDELNVVKNGAVVIKDGRIVYAGPHTDDYDAAETIDASGKVVSPALVDAHTHLTFGGSREHEMSLKRQGKSYLEILEMGAVYYLPLMLLEKHPKRTCLKRQSMICLL